MPFTTQGFTPRRYTEIIEEIRLALETELGTPISSDPDTVIGTLLSVFGDEIAEQENLNQAHYNNLDIDKAEGVFLDRLVAYIGLERLPASPSSGQLKVWRDSQGQIFSSTLYSTTAGTEYSAINGLTHNLTDCNEILLTPSSTLANTEYSITINGDLYSITSDSDPTKEEICIALADLINSLSSFTATQEGDNVRVYDTDVNQNSMSVSYSRMSLLEIATFNFVESVNVGSLTTDINTITEVVTPNTSLLRCNNPLDFTDGRDIETDEELRARAEVSTQVAGVATVPAITASLLQLNGVSSAAVIENRTTETDLEGRPAKSYECIVEGGNPNNIANTIWETKPAGVETYGDITTIITDFANNQQAINWSRPDPVYVHVRITYTKYDEESFPTDGEELIKETVVDSGNDLGLGVDIIPSRFIGEIHRNVQGIDSILVEVGTSASPVDPNPTSWQTTSIPVASNEFGEFANGRVTVIDNTPP